MNVQTPSKQKILNAVIELLSMRKLANITATDIIHESGVSHQTFYRLFSDKFDAIEEACFQLLSNSTAIVGTNSTVKEQTLCLLQIVKTYAAFFKHLLSTGDGDDAIKSTLIRLSEQSINFKSSETITNAWIYCLQEWCATNFEDSIQDVYFKIIGNYPVEQVIFGDDLKKVLDKYGEYHMKELDALCNSKQ